MGDFREEYLEVCRASGPWIAKFWYWSQIFKSIPYFFRNRAHWGIIMIKNYLKITIRNIRRHKGFSFITIAGLSIGITCCLLILLWVQDELSYDEFHDKAEQTYRVNIVDSMSSKTIHAGITPSAIGPFLRDNYPEVTDSTRMLGTPIYILKTGDKIINEFGYFVDPSFLDIFTFPKITGNEETPLSAPLSIVLTQNMAAKMFGNLDAVGKTVTVNDRLELLVTGIIQNPPENSMFDDLHFLIPMENVRNYGFDLDSWGNITFFTFVQLQKKSNMEAFNKKIAGVYKEQDPDMAKVTFYLQPLGDIHLHSENLIAALGGNGNIKYIYLFSILAVFILVLACVNFMNLTTARSEKKAREVGVRKVVGAVKGDLIFQFFGESLFMTFVALIIALFSVVLLLPVFNNITSKTMAVGRIDLTYIIGIVVVAIFTGLIAGSYPAFFLSSFQPVQVLRSSTGKMASRGSQHLRKILVVFQFSISVILMICTFVVLDQMAFIKKSDIGLARQQIVYLRLRGNVLEKKDTFKQELLRDPGILSATLCSHLPTSILNVNIGLDWEGKDPEDPGRMNVLSVDDDFLDTFQMELVEGRGFEKEFTANRVNVILNESALEKTGIESPVGKRFVFDEERGEIIGIVKNFHFRSLHSEIGPLVIIRDPSQYGYICLKTKASEKSISSTIAHIRNTWNTFSPGYEFTYGFLDEHFENMYSSEQRLGKIFNHFTFLAFFISCLGLLGLAAFMAERRTKEIGIRKVMGASHSSIIKLLNKEYAVLLIIANVVAWPVAYFAMHKWLQNFAFRAQIHIGIFILSGSLTVLIAFLTVSVQAVRAAKSDPTKSLRGE
jgi:ABC-type antimicrobial peptide transport system permease subunit